MVLLLVSPGLTPVAAVIRCSPGPRGSKMASSGFMHNLRLWYQLLQALCPSSLSDDQAPLHVSGIIQIGEDKISRSRSRIHMILLDHILLVKTNHKTSQVLSTSGKRYDIVINKKKYIQTVPDLPWFNLNAFSTL